MGKKLRKRRIFKILHWVCYVPPWIAIVILAMSLGMTRRLLLGMIILGGVMIADWISSHYYLKDSSPTSKGGQNR